ncbi:hypothetical protein ACROYT_G021003 [Oculina patagonica]
MFFPKTGICRETLKTFTTEVPLKLKGQLQKQRSGKDIKGYLLKMNQAKLFAVLFALCLVMALVTDSGNAARTKKGNEDSEWKDLFSKFMEWEKKKKTGEEKKLKDV